MVLKSTRSFNDDENLNGSTAGNNCMTVYDTQRSCLVICDSRVTVYGEGKASVIEGSYAYPLLQIGGFIWHPIGKDDLAAGYAQNINYSGVNNLGFVNTAASGTSIGVSLRGAARGWIHHLWFDGMHTAVEVRTQSAHNNIHNISSQKASRDISPYYVILVNGEGYTANNNSTMNQYDTIWGTSVRHSVMRFEGATFGDICISNIQGGGANGFAGVSLVAGAYYHENITMSNIDIDGSFTYGVYAIGCSDINISGLITGGLIGTPFYMPATTVYTVIQEGSITVTGIVTASCGTLSCDHVFEPGYDLLSLDDLGSYIDKENHLPGMTISRGMDSMDLGNAVKELLIKVEEQSIYILQLHERLKVLEAKLN